MLGVDDNTGAGGANVWTHGLLKALRRPAAATRETAVRAAAPAGRHAGVDPPHAAGRRAGRHAGRGPRRAARRAARDDPRATCWRATSTCWTPPARCWPGGRCAGSRLTPSLAARHADPAAHDRRDRPGRRLRRRPAAGEQRRGRRCHDADLRRGGRRDDGAGAGLRLRRSWWRPGPSRSDGGRAILRSVVGPGSGTASLAGTETPSTGLTAAGVAERVAAGRTNATSPRTSRTRRRDHPGQRLHPLQRHPRRAARRRPDVGPLAGRAVRPRPRRQRRDRHRAGAAGQAHPRPARGAQRPTAPGSCATAPSAEVAVEDVVLDDLLVLRTGDQVPGRRRRPRGDGLEVDESLLTGESDPVDKAAGDEVLSGSIVVAGRGPVPGDGRGRSRRLRAAGWPPRRAGSRSTRSELDGRHQPLLRYITLGAGRRRPARCSWSQLRADDDHDWRDAVPARSPAWSAWCPRAWCCSRASRSWSPR